MCGRLFANGGTWPAGETASVSQVSPAFGPVLGIELVISLEIQIVLLAGDREQVADLRTDADNSAV